MGAGKYSALSGALGRMSYLETISDNLANVKTVGFKRGQAVFESKLASAQAGLATGGKNFSEVRAGLSALGAFSDSAASAGFSDGVLLRGRSACVLAAADDSFAGLSAFTRDGLSAVSDVGLSAFVRDGLSAASDVGLSAFVRVGFLASSDFGLSAFASVGVELDCSALDVAALGDSALGVSALGLSAWVSAELVDSPTVSCFGAFASEDWADVSLDCDSSDSRLARGFLGARCRFGLESDFASVFSGCCFGSVWASVCDASFAAFCCSLSAV